MGDIDREFPMIEYRDVYEFERERAESLRCAALLGYGALLATNNEGRLDLVLNAIKQVLWPQLPSPPKGEE